MGRLNDLAVKHGADKASGLVGRESHGYADWYEELLGKYPKDVRLLEIGLWDPQLPGASPRMWREFLPKSRLYGMDIDPGSKQLEKEIGMQVAIVDQGIAWQLQTAMYVFGKMDVIIDDGSHINAHFVTSLRALWPFLDRGGTYVIEDLHAPQARPAEVLENVVKELDDVESSGFISPKLFSIHRRP